jgi:hypothetical protein
MRFDTGIRLNYIEICNKLNNFRCFRPILGLCEPAPKFVLLGDFQSFYFILDLQYMKDKMVQMDAKLEQHNFRKEAAGTRECFLCIKYCIYSQL